MLRARAASTSQPQEMKVSVCDSQTFEPTPTFPLWPALAPLGSLTSRPRQIADGPVPAIGRADRNADAPSFERVRTGDPSSPGIDKS